MEFNLCPFQSIVCLHDDNFQEKGEIQLATNSQKWPLMSRQVLKLEFTQFLVIWMNGYLFLWCWNFISCLHSLDIEIIDVTKLLRTLKIEIHNIWVQPYFIKQNFSDLSWKQKTALICKSVWWLNIDLYVVYLQQKCTFKTAKNKCPQ